MSEFDSKELRRALGQFPTGVTVMTARNAEQLVGVTASSFNTVSLTPPLILWSVDKAAFSAEVFMNTSYFVVNVLSEHQSDISNKFASKGADKFAGIEYFEGIGDVPVLKECAAHFECEVWNIHDGGDHFVIMGEVKKYEYVENLNPLIFAKGKYRNLAALEPLES